MRAKDILTKSNLAGTIWGNRIIRAEKRGYFSEHDEDLAHGWTTCACGKLDKRIPRDDDGEPKDGILSNMGDKFNCAVRGNFFLTTAKSLISIKKRATKILAGMK